jgi:hypothetical protein
MWTIFPPLQFRAHDSNWPKQVWVKVIDVSHGDDTLRLFGR